MKVIFMKNLNRIFVFLVAITLLVSCSLINQANYYKLDDEFTGRKTFTISQYITPTERNFDVGNAKITFQRTVSENDENLIAYFVINRYSSSFNMENKGFLKANDQKYELLIDKKNTEYRTSTSTKTSNTVTKDSTKVSTVNNTETSTNNWYEEKFSISLNQDITSSLMKGNEIFFRFYFGPQVATYKFSPSQITAFKRIFTDEL